MKLVIFTIIFCEQTVTTLGGELVDSVDLITDKV